MANLKDEKQFGTIIEEINTKIQQASGQGDSGAYIALGEYLKSLRHECREAIQAITRDQAKEVIKKLKAKTQLAQDDLSIIRLWIVGDADHYIATENNFNDWKEEVGRLQAEIQKYQGQAMNANSLSLLQALITDLDRTTQKITMYLRDYDRVKRFEKSTEEIDEQERKTLIELMQRRLDSHHM